MIVLIHKKRIRLFFLLPLFLCCMAAVLWFGREVRTTQVFSPTQTSNTVYVIDAGHGGEDGGAVAKDGTVESGINLEIAARLNDLLQFVGQNTQMVRTSDISIYTDGAKTLREKKVSDLKNRVELVNGTKDAVLISIHQNCLPSAPSVHGAQVFFSAVPGSDELAAPVQITLNTTINAGAKKEAKQISSSIYLMKHVTAPAILVECGFLSNPQETTQLQQKNYQLRIAAAITGGLFAPLAPQN